MMFSRLLSNISEQCSDTVLGLIVWLSFLVLVVVAISIFGQVLFAGFHVVSLDFLWQLPSKAGLEGGLLSILVGTGAIMTICMGVSLPLALAVAIYIAEFTRPGPGNFHFVLVSLDVMAAVPSIVFGLFGNVLFCHFFGFGYSILSGGLTLACMVLPILTRASVDAFLNLPHHLRRSGWAVGFSKVEVIWYVLLPTAAPAILAAFLLSLARALSETAALVFTAGYADRMPASIFDSARTISIHIYDLAMNIPGGEERAYGAAMVLLVFLLSINGITRLLMHPWVQYKIVA